MASVGNIISDIKIDKSNDIWITGADVVKYDGSNFNKYNFTNSAVPSNSPYYLDTRSISIDGWENKWIGCATAPYVSDVLLFKLTGEYAESSETWNPSDLGLTGDSFETSKIYSSPYGGETIAFITDLNNGAGVTGSTGPFGITGGRLFRYEEAVNKWSEVLEEYNWNHTYDIKSRGIDGKNYEYFIATEIGILIFRGGSDSVGMDLVDSDDGIGSVRILNQNNSGLPSSEIYSLDFDENGNLWIGTGGGLVFLSIEGEYTVWNSSNSDIPSGPEISLVKSAPNGQVFFAMGDGYTGNGNGLFYFNGDVVVNYTDSNSDLPNNNVTEIVSFWKKSKNKETTYYQDEILITCLNDISLFNYVTPHVYASAKEAGTIGWNFIDHKPSDGVSIPRVDKYSWEYPSWRTYQDLYLADKNPGLDRRNLFLSVPLSDIADGSAGKQEYWNRGEVPDYLELKEARKIPLNTWTRGITGSTDLSNSGEVSVEIFDDKYVVGISISPSSTINLGNSPDGSPVTFSNVNSTFGSPSPSNIGLIAYYNKFGQLEGYNKIRGKSTYIYDIKKSEDENSLYVLGGYNNYVEAGEFLYGDYPGGASGGGPTGSPVGISNINSENIQGATGNYPWILSEYSGGTGSPFIPSWYGPTGGNFGFFLMEIDKNIGSETSLGGIDLTDPKKLRSSYFLKKFRHFPTNFEDESLVENVNLEVTDKYIKISSYIGGTGSSLYTYSNEDLGYFDKLGLSKILGNNKGDLGETSVYLKLDKDFNLKSTLDVNSGVGTSGGIKIKNITTEKGNGTTMISGFADSVSFSFGDLEIGAGITSGNYGFYLLMDSNDNPIISEVNRDILGENSISSSSGIDRHYIFNGITGPNSTSFGIKSNIIETEYGSSVISVEPSGSRKLIGTYEIEVDPSISFGIGDTSISESYIHSVYSGPSGGIMLKTGLDGGNSDYYELGLLGPTGFNIEGFSYVDSEAGDLFYSCKNTGPGDDIFLGLSLGSLVKTGKSMGSILSNSGTNPWKWSDIFRDEKNMKIPLMSTVFFTNYDSNIFGKNSNRWVLTNQKSGEELLEIKNSPYFIYTFNESGIYSIYNSIEDSKGNVYEVSKTSFVEVINHNERKIEDNDPRVINSEDYGFPSRSTTREDDFYRISKDLEEQKMLIEKESRPKFGSGVSLKENPDATFNDDRGED